jgi:DNA-binding protein HU-beta
VKKGKEHLVNKAQLIDAIADSTGLSKAVAEKMLDVTIGTITRSLKDGDTVTIVGFGTFKVSARAARSGRNPRTGEAIDIKAAKVPKFSAGKALKDAIN